jgi:hypothetical protein
MASCCRTMFDRRWWIVTIILTACIGGGIDYGFGFTIAMYLLSYPQKKPKEQQAEEEDDDQEEEKS